MPAHAARRASRHEPIVSRLKEVMAKIMRARTNLSFVPSPQKFNLLTSPFCVETAHDPAQPAKARDGDRGVQSPAVEPQGNSHAQGQQPHHDKGHRVLAWDK